MAYKTVNNSDDKELGQLLKDLKRFERTIEALSKLVEKDREAAQSIVISGDLKVLGAKVKTGETIAEIIAIYHPDIAMRMLNDEKLRNFLEEESILGNVVARIVEKSEDLAKEIIEKYPDFLNLRSKHNTYGYETGADIIAMQYPKLRGLMRVKFIPYYV